MDIFADPVPEELVGRYDVIHIRLFMLVILSGDPIPLLKNLMKLLKPGEFWNAVRDILCQRFARETLEVNLQQHPKCQRVEGDEQKADEI